MFKKTMIAVLATAAIAGTSITAFASEDDAVSVETQNQIRTTLEEQGYEVRKIKAEDGMYEAYAMKNGKRLEIYLDGDMKILNTKEND
jgi:hypothetical protein